MTDTKVNLYRYYPPRRHTDMVVTDNQILKLWSAKRDSYDITLQTGIPEHEVVSRLWRIREGHRVNAEWNFDRLQSSPACVPLKDDAGDG